MSGSCKRLKRARETGEWQLPGAAQGSREGASGGCERLQKAREMGEGRG